MSWWCSNCERESAPTDDTCGEVIQRCEHCGRAGVLNWHPPTPCIKPRKPAAVLPARPRRGECTNSTALTPAEITAGFKAIREGLEKAAGGG